MHNLDEKTVADFGFEWTRLDQSQLPAEEAQKIFEGYFHLFPWDSLPTGAVGFDLGCGSGRWARLVAPRVGQLHCIDASEPAIQVARKALANLSQCVFHVASVDDLPLANGSMDFGYSLGVLHHVPDPLKGIQACVAKLRPGAPFLVYLYYAFDQKPLWFKTLWRASDVLRRLLCRLPPWPKYWVCTVLAALVYFPLARGSLILESLGLHVDSLPLSFYRTRSFYTMRTDALDRFGTRLEKRFTAPQVQELLEKGGLERVQFSSSPPYWCALGFKKPCVG
jgi:SAM-dependent methyltransferase